MSLVRNRGGAAGASVSSSPSRYVDVESGTRQITKDEQHVRIKSNLAHSNAIMPYSTDVSNGHFIDLFRDIGSFDQLITSHDALVGDIVETEKTPEAHIHLVGGPKDVSPNPYHPQVTDNASFVVDNDVLGAKHSVCLLYTSDAADE